MTRTIPARRLVFLLASLVGHLCAAGEAVRIPWLQDNRAPNPGFEELVDDGRTAKAWSAIRARGKGATVVTDPTVFLEGRRSLRIDVLQSPARVSARSQAVPVDGGAAYLFSIAFRQQGFNTTGKPSHYGGVSSYCQVQWLDAARKSVGHFTVAFPYGPSRWDLRDALKPAPAGARFAQVTVTVANRSLEHSGKTIPATLWIDAVQLRQHVPPPTPDWAKGETTRVVDGAPEDLRVRAYFVGGDDAFHNMRGGTWSRTVTDPQAERGTALEACSGVKKGFMAHSPYWRALPPGLYRVRARVKMPAVKDNAPVGFLDIVSEHAGHRLVLPFVPSRDTAGRYTDLDGDVILRGPGYWCVRLRTYGKQTWSIDSVKIFCLDELEDRQLLAIYPGTEGDLPADLTPARFGTASAGPGSAAKALVVAGLGYDRFRLADVCHGLHPDARIKPVWVKSGRSGMSFVGLPERSADLFQYAIIYLCNVNVRSMALKYKNAIREYVKRGGALVVMGGQQGYERGGWKGSLIGETMPVEVAPALRGGLIHTPTGQVLSVSRDATWLEGISTACAPRVYYLHTVTPKPSGRVLVRAGDRPFLVTGAYGKGRVVCILGVPYGDPGPEQTPFWAWDDWFDLLREVCWWAMRAQPA